MFASKSNTEHHPAHAATARQATFFAPRIQTKLTVNTPGDAYEQEADRVADQVMKAPLPSTGNFVPNGGNVQPKCADCEKEEKAQRKESPAMSSKAEGSAAPPIVSDVLSSGGGQSMDNSTRQFMESRFGQDFSQVRIHTGGRAAESAGAIQARAYTSGRDIVFGAGEYQPSSESGRRLLAHELVHVGQQQNEGAKIQRDGFGDVRIAEGYNEILTQIKASPKLQSLSYDEKKLTADIIQAIEQKPDWPTRYDYIANLLTLFKRTAEKTYLDSAKAKILTLGLNKTKVTALLETLSKPLLGYVASGFDFSSRFFQHAGPLGFSVENPALGSFKSDPYDRGQPASVTNPAEESFKKSDILFFSGHQYAQYKEPGNFTDDSSTSCFNIGMLSKENKRVKLIVSTSCATICKDVAKIWRSKFPDALILGYRYSAPIDGGIVSNAFAKELLKIGPIDLADSGSMQSVREAWKAVVLGKGSIGGGPGLLYGNEVEFWSNKKWVKKPWDDKANECHYH